MVHVEEEAKMAPEKVKNASRERGKGVWNRQGQVTLRVANPVVGHSEAEAWSRLRKGNHPRAAFSMKRQDTCEIQYVHGASIRANHH